jgi:hypothetical protein
MVLGSGAYISKLAPRLLENMFTPGVKDKF